MQTRLLHLVRLAKRHRVDTALDPVREGLDPLQLRNTAHPTRGHLLRWRAFAQGHERAARLLAARRRHAQLSQYELLQFAEFGHVRLCARLFRRRIHVSGL